MLYKHLAIKICVHINKELNVLTFLLSCRFVIYLNAERVVGEFADYVVASVVSLLEFLTLTLVYSDSN